MKDLPKCPDSTKSLLPCKFSGCAPVQDNRLLAIWYKTLRKGMSKQTLVIQTACLWLAQEINKLLLGLWMCIFIISFVFLYDTLQLNGAMARQIH